MRNHTHHGHFRSTAIGLLLLVPFLFACQGPIGPAGPQGTTGAAGPQGSTGAAGTSCTATDNNDGTKTITCADGTSITLTNGQPGTTTGTLTGTVTSSIGGGASGVTVTPAPLPDGVTAATTDTDGNFSLTLPAGVYSLEFASSDYATKDVADVSLIAGGTADVSVTLDRTNPLVVTTNPVYLAGFGSDVTLGETVSGATGSNLTYTWTQVSGPTTATLTGADTATPTFTTASFDDIVNSGAVDNLYREERAEMMPITNNQMVQMSYVFKVTVSDGTFTTSANQTVQTMSRVGPWKNFPRGLLAVTNDLTTDSSGAPVTTYDWSITAKPATSTATLHDATARNAWFIPDVDGDFTVTNATTGNSITITAATWKGVNDNCKTCHNGTISPDLDQYDEWKNSGHAHHFENGINGVLGSHYGKSCISCHTVGYDPATDNGGFDDVAKTDGWTYPAENKPGNYAALPDNLKNLGNIQCENCHGPGSSHNGNPANITVSWDARNCAFCHDAPPHHDRFPLWSKSPHANRQLALEEATTEGRGAMAAHCGRCHSAQGFAQYVDQLQAGDTGWLKGPDGQNADVAYLNSIGLDKAHVQPQTCPSCHDPHTLELRLDGSTPIKLPGGFTARGLGKGTTCIACHNSRNGEHDDMNPPTNYSGPHVAAQGDVFMGKNAYFVDGYNVSVHSAIGDSCATCHVKIVPASVNTGGSNHTFVPDSSICASCHSPDVDGKGLQANVQAGLDDLDTMVGQVVTSTVSAIVNGTGASTTYQVKPYDPTTGLYAQGPITLSQVPTAVALAEVHGQMALDFTLGTGVDVTWSDGSTSTVTDVQFQLGTLTDASGSPLYATDSILVKSLWNIGLVSNDGTKGIHNPSFVLKVLTATQGQLRTLILP